MGLYYLSSVVLPTSRETAFAPSGFPKSGQIETFDAPTVLVVIRRHNRGYNLLKLRIYSRAITLLDVNCPPLPILKEIFSPRIFPSLF